MMLKLVHRDTNPPGGWSYYQEETKTWITQGDYLRLVSAVERHRREHNIPIGPLFEEEIEHQIASRPESHSMPVEVPEVLPSRRTTMDDVERFVTTAYKWLHSGGTFVPIDEAERRASICATCPENANVRGCSWCRHTLNAMNKHFARQTTSKDGLLRACAVCGCELKVAVHIPVGDPEPGLAYPPHCWKLQPPRGVVDGGDQASVVQLPDADVGGDTLHD